MRFSLFLALVPVLLYCISYVLACARARQDKVAIPAFFGNKFHDAFFWSLIIAISIYLFIFIANISKGNGSDYSSPAQKLQRQYIVHPPK